MRTCNTQGTRAITVLALGLLFQSVMGGLTPSMAQATEPHASIFIRYQFDLAEIMKKLEAAQGKPLDPRSIEGQWLDEMGWRKVLNEYSQKPFTLTQELKTQLLNQDRFIRETFSYQVGDAVWVAAEVGEQPYGHSQARVNVRGKIAQIIKGEKETYFVCEVGVDNGAKDGMEMKQGKFYDGRMGQVLDYGSKFKIEKKTYVYSLSEIDRFNAPFRSELIGSDTGAKVDYAKDAKWLKKVSEFKDKVVKGNLEVDFTKSPEEILAAQKKLIKLMFNHFKMNRNAPGGGPLLGDVANGGGGCFTQACVLSHGVHAVGEPYGISVMNISGSTVNPSGGHGFTRIMVRGPAEVHVYDLVKDAQGQTKYSGMEIKSGRISYISDPGWADYGKTPDQFSMMPIEDAINPIPIDANRAIYDLIQGKSYEDVVVKYGNKGSFVVNTDLKGDLFKGSKQAEFLAPKAQIIEAALLEKSLGGELSALVDEAKNIKASSPHARELKSKIFTELVEPKIGSLKVPGLTADGVRILVTEYVFRAVK